MGQQYASRTIFVCAASVALARFYPAAPPGGHHLPRDLWSRRRRNHRPWASHLRLGVHSSSTGTWRSVAAGITNQANVNASGGRSVTVFNSGSGVAQAGCNSRDDDMLNVNAGEPSAYLYDTIDDGIALNNANLRGNAYISGTAWGGTTDARRCLYWTPEYSVDPANYAPGSLKFSWYQGNGNTTDAPSIGHSHHDGAGHQSVVRYDDRLHQLDAHYAGDLQQRAELKEVPFSTAAAGWTSLVFDGKYDTVTDTGTDSTVGLSLGSPAAADLPAGVITGFGIFSNDPLITGAANRRFDSFTIQGTPLVVGDSSWNVDADGNWSAPATGPAAVPNGVGAQATFGNKITAARTVTVDSAQTVGTNSVRQRQQLHRRRRQRADAGRLQRSGGHHRQSGFSRDFGAGRLEQGHDDHLGGRERRELERQSHGDGKDGHQGRRG